MAALVEGRIRAVDSSGNPLTGATLTIYTANTTTPVSIFSDAGLSVAMSNPTTGSDKSDAGGWFPQIWAAEGTTVDILLKNAAGTLVQSYSDVVFLGSTTGAFIKDLTNSRVQIRNSGGVVQYETGNATGDDVGGSGRLGGWAGTQGDDLSVDYATVGLTGLLTESNGKKLQGVVYTPRTTFSAAATVDIALPNVPSGTIAWAVEIYELVLSLDANLLGRLSYDNGVTYKSAAGNYDGVDTLLAYAPATTVLSTVTATTSFNFATGLDNAHTARTARIVATVITNTGGTVGTSVDGQVFAMSSATGTSSTWAFNAWGVGGFGRATHLRLFPSTGTISGAYRVVPLRGYE